MNEQLREKAYKATHDSWNLLLSLKSDDLESIVNIVKIVSLNGPQEVAMFYEGLIKGILFAREHICPTCGVKHDGEDHSVFNETYEQKLAMAAESFMSQTGKSIPTSSTGSADHRPGTYL